MSNVDFLQQVITADGFVTASVLAKVLHITQTDLAEVTGLSIDSVSKSASLAVTSSKSCSALERVFGPPDEGGE